MAYSNCIKCGNVTFEVVENEPLNSSFKLNFIQCAKCGGVVGVMDYYNIGSMLEKLGQRLSVDLT